MLVNTTPLYENGTITDGFLRFEDFCIVISRIKAYKNYTETDGEDSITTLVQKAQIDLIKYTHKLMERLVEDDSSYFNSKEKDIIRSIYEGFFNPESLNSIFGITRSVRDYRAPNYYNLILQSIASMF